MRARSFGKLIITIWILALGYSPPGYAKKLVWIDTDPACGYRDSSDVDDCLALALAFNSPELEIIGISTVYGNESLGVSKQTLNQFLKLIQSNADQKAIPSIFKGALHDHAHSLDLTEASRAIARALKKEKLTIIALGPMTNIASVIHNYPELQGQINSIIAVAGKSPDKRFRPGNNYLTLIRDFNFKKDRSSFGKVFHTEIPLVLTGFEAASHVKITSKDIQKLEKGSRVSKWLAKQSVGWLKLWNDVFLNEGFYPFDSLAIGYAVNPKLLGCQNLPARIKKINLFFIWKINHEIEIAPDIDGERQVVYCHKTNKVFHDFLMNRLLYRDVNKLKFHAF